MPSRIVDVRRAEVRGQDPPALAASLYAALGAGDAMALAVVFVPPGLDRAALATELAARFGDTPVVGCTTAGEIGPSGMLDGATVGFALPASAFQVAIERVPSLSRFQQPDGVATSARLLGTLRDRGIACEGRNSFVMLLADGLSAREEVLVNALDGALGGIPLFGGSAGDGLAFGGTAVLAGGRFDPDTAVVVLVHTTLPFRVFKTQHLEATPHQFVVTQADVASRVVTELDGEPAAIAYARAVGVGADELTPDTFASNPVVVRLGGAFYVRSIQKRNDDDSLTFYCAIDEGLVLSLARGSDIVGSLQQTLEGLRGDIGPFGLVIGCDCILRRLEIERLGVRERMSALLAEHRVIGFGTYGEQFHGVHVNQTFTGVAIGSGAREAA